MTLEQILYPALILFVVVLSVIFMMRGERHE